MNEVIDIPFPDFVVGISNNTMKFEIVNNSKFAKLYFTKFDIFLIRCILFLVVAPFILIPVICIVYSNYWLLFAFVGIYFGTLIHGINIKTKNPIKNLIELSLCLLLLLSVLIYFIGFFQPFVFAFTCLVYSFISLDLSDHIYEELAQRRVMKNGILFSYSIEQRIIRIRITE